VGGPSIGAAHKGLKVGGSRPARPNSFRRLWWSWKHIDWSCKSCCFEFDSDSHSQRREDVRNSSVTWFTLYRCTAMHLLQWMTLNILC